jgi:hypothetical protein
MKGKEYLPDYQKLTASRFSDLMLILSSLRLAKNTKQFQRLSTAMES